MARGIAGWFAVASALALSGMSIHAQPPAAPPASRDVPSSDVTPLRMALLDTEDARAPRDADLVWLLAALAHPSEEVQRIAVRALGRLERPPLLPHMTPLLSATSPAVRREAAGAIGLTLAGSGDSDAGPAEQQIVDRLAAERDQAVCAALLETLGWMPLRSEADVRVAERALVAALRDSGPATQLRAGAAKGLESLVRLHAKAVAPRPDTVAALTAVVRSSVPGDARARRLALGALSAAGAVDADTIRNAMRDADQQVRRLAMVATNAAKALDDRAALLRAGLRDPSAMVRYDALRAYGARFADEDCGPIRTAVDDAGPEVTFLALDLLGGACQDPNMSMELLTHVAGDGDWHRAAHAMVSLARQSPERVRPFLGRASSSALWQLRVHAARAAGIVGDVALLERLAVDPDANVTEAAIEDLARVAAHTSDRIYVQALARDDYQVVLAAAHALEGTPKNADTATALIGAFDRLTRQRRDTSRDPRMAVLVRLKEVGDSTAAPALEPCLADFDPDVAVECASIIAAWKGGPAPPVRPASVRAPLPSAAELTRLATARARITMKRGVVELRLLTDEAPLSVARFAALAGRGYYNGLTFHRVVPNFVIQGGSPGANEYVGDGAYLRDEVGFVSHVRGTVGISTRGRDTGDAQIFVNLVDNWRLDHIDTVFAEVTTGMDVIDGVLEGDVIEKVEIVEK